MTVAYAEHQGQWTEEDFLAMDDPTRRIELIDGNLVVSPSPTPKHQTISRRLAAMLDQGAESAGLLVLEAVNVRLRPGRIPIPDLVVTEQIDLDKLVIDVEDVRLVCEIVSPSNAANDKVRKMQYYSAAGIPWYLLVEQKTTRMHLYRLDGDQYREHAAVEPGTVFKLTDPMVAEIDTAALVPRA